jgi:arylsulfatase A
MNRARFALVGCLILAVFPAVAIARQPNVIVFLADDFGYECVGANGGGSYKTPQLDTFASDGARFTHLHVQPLCTPTRAQLMTGIYNVRNYVNFGYMDPKATTFGQLFKNAGYATCMVGKWQLGTDVDKPKSYGFDEHCLWQHTRRPPRYANPGLEINGKPVDFAKGEYGPDVINDFALKFVENHREKPFFLYYSSILTHSPYQPTPESADWDPKAIGERANVDKKHFGEMVAYMDKLFGKLLARLDELKLRDDTLIVFLGDNGTGKGITSQLEGKPVDGAKGLTTRYGMHVPLLVRWPGKVKAGLVNDDLIDSTDLLPTICEAAGVKTPVDLKLDGRSFWPQLQGEKGQPREWFYCWFSADGGPRLLLEFAANKTHKLYRDGRWFNYVDDPLEKKPLERPTEGAAATDYAMLQGVLDRYKDARPKGIISKKKGISE